MYFICYYHGVILKMETFTTENVLLLKTKLMDCGKLTINKNIFIKNIIYMIN